MKLHECNPGDVVAIIWPESDYWAQLAGTEQIVKVNNVLGGRKKGTQPHCVIVSTLDRETMLVNESVMRGISPDVDVIEVVERHGGANDGDGHDSGEDFTDPVRGRQR